MFVCVCCVRERVHMFVYAKRACVRSAVADMKAYMCIYIYLSIFSHMNETCIVDVYMYAYPDAAKCKYKYKDIRMGARIQ